MFDGALNGIAKGDPKLAQDIAARLASAGIKSKLDSARAWDHGVFVPLMLAYPDARYPIVSISLNSSLDPKLHYQVGEALAPLREEGVLIIASGMSFHNMSAFDFRADRNSPLKGSQFDEDLRNACMAKEAGKRKALLINWEAFREARYCHPQEEHFIPLLVAAGAGGNDVGRVAHSGAFSGTRITSFMFGQKAKLPSQV